MIVTTDSYSPCITCVYYKVLLKTPPILISRPLIGSSPQLRIKPITRTTKKTVKTAEQLNNEQDRPSQVSCITRMYYKQNEVKSAI